MTELPFMRFFVNDWLSDPCVRALTLPARGLWFEMLCQMWKGLEKGQSEGLSKGFGRGYLAQANGKAITDEQLARLAGISVEEVKTLLPEMEDVGVFSRTDEGVIYSRRIVRDEKIRQERAAGGELGASFGRFGGRPKKTPSGTPSATPSGTPSAITSEFRVQSSEINTPPLPPDQGCVRETNSVPIKPPKIDPALLEDPDVEDPRFVKFWQAYPRKHDRLRAAEAFARLNPDDALLAVILTAVAKQRAGVWLDKEIGYVPYPTSWLHNRRWEDETIDARVPPAPPARTVYFDEIKDKIIPKSRSIDEIFGPSV
jgi:hypothetical protein